MLEEGGEEEDRCGWGINGKGCEGEQGDVSEVTERNG